MLLSRLSHLAAAPAALALIGCASAYVEPAPSASRAAELGAIAPGWEGEIISLVDQSYAGWDVEIGDVDGDGRNEILTGSAPDSRLYRFDKRDDAWDTRVLVDGLASSDRGLILGARIVDLNGDGSNEILAGTGEEDGSIAKLAILKDDGATTTTLASTRSSDNTSSYTHGLATYDLDRDGILDIVSSYCGNGEVIRYRPSEDLRTLASRKVLQLSGSGEDSWLADVDGDGVPELILANGFRDGAAKVQIHDLDPETGNPRPQPRIVLDGYAGQRMFYASIAVGDLDSDGFPELIIGWKAKQAVNRSHLVAYHVAGDQAEVAFEIAADDPDLDLGYFEKMIAIDDLDGDGRNEMYLSTRGDGESEGITSAKLGRIYRYQFDTTGVIARDTLIDFDPTMAESAWLATGDIDADGRKELVIATGRGDRLMPGWSWVMALRRTPPRSVTASW